MLIESNISLEYLPRLSITTIENLFNELFHEIFDYLDGQHIYQAFSNINQRFEQLITSSSLLFKIQCSSSTETHQFMNQWRRIVSDHRSQIFSINLSCSLLYDELFSSFLIDSSLNHLESLALWNIKFNILISILEKLSSLSRLHHLNIDMFDTSINLTNIYQSILNLSTLKYFKFTPNGTNLSISLPIVTNGESPLQYLLIAEMSIAARQRQDFFKELTRRGRFF